MKYVAPKYNEKYRRINKIGLYPTKTENDFVFKQIFCSVMVGI